MGKLNIVVINGVARSGKDSFVRFLQEYFRTKYNGITINHSTIDAVKEAAKHFGADETRKKSDAERRLWSDMKDAYTRYCDGPFMEIVMLANSMKKAFDNTLLTLHIREPQEIEKVKKHFGNICTTILIERPDQHIPDNYADQEACNYSYEFYIKNDSDLRDLHDKAECFLDKIMEKK